MTRTRALSPLPWALLVAAIGLPACGRAGQPTTVVESRLPSPSYGHAQLANGLVSKCALKSATTLKAQDAKSVLVVDSYLSFEVQQKPEEVIVSIEDDTSRTSVNGKRVDTEASPQFAERRFSVSKQLPPKVALFPDTRDLEEPLAIKVAKIATLFGPLGDALPQGEVVTGPIDATTVELLLRFLEGSGVLVASKVTDAVGSVAAAAERDGLALVNLDFGAKVAGENGMYRAEVKGSVLLRAADGLVVHLETSGPFWLSLPDTDEAHELALSMDCKHDAR